MISRMRDILSPPCPRRKPVGISRTTKHSSSPVQSDRRFRLVTTKKLSLETSGTKSGTKSEPSNSKPHTPLNLRVFSPSDHIKKSIKETAVEGTPARAAGSSDMYEYSLFGFQWSKSPGGKADQFPRMLSPKSGVENIHVPPNRVFKCCYCDITRYSCNKCSKTYKHYASLHHHLNYECGVAPKFPCEICSYAAKRKHHLQSHYKYFHKMRKCDI
ncbi:unnamed protein product [Acanthoscelides obtectus]|uniref:C2H2-type domain-containing protein n=1 Tax=Acanthoscelides obtectus TaxID=200917 RepID=A0A9P0JZB7_ACAOB|nr:unnamed protein product [Acanthoscelides obtectus]CAK1669706.1 Longitudinals lacking protein, isoforms A/B/D/L [Acanthoscelides obtectus]